MNDEVTEVQTLLERAKSERKIRSAEYDRLKMKEQMLQEQVRPASNSFQVISGLELKLREQGKEKLKGELQKIQSDLEAVKQSVERAQNRIDELEEWLAEHE